MSTRRAGAERVAHFRMKLKFLADSARRNVLSRYDQEHDYINRVD
jgi:hypothetical protein